MREQCFRIEVKEAVAHCLTLAVTVRHIHPGTSQPESTFPGRWMPFELRHLKIGPVTQGLGGAATEVTQLRICELHAIKESFCGAKCQRSLKECEMKARKCEEPKITKDRLSGRESFTSGHEKHVSTAKHIKNTLSSIRGHTAAHSVRCWRRASSE